MSNKIESITINHFRITSRNKSSQRKNTFQDQTTKQRSPNVNEIKHHKLQRIVSNIRNRGSSLNATPFFTNTIFNSSFDFTSALNHHLAKVALLQTSTVQKNKENAQSQNIDQEKQKVKQFAKKGLEKLTRYMSKNTNAYKCFADWDEDSSNDLGRDEISRFLIASEIQQFLDEATLRQAVTNIFSQFSSDRIKKNDILEYFQISTKASKKTMGRLHSNLLLIKPSIRAVKNPQQLNSPILKTTKRKSQISSDFPLALQYYRRKPPLSENIVFIKELQYLLKNQKIFSDPQNPKTLEKYIYANQIFQDDKYQLIRQTKRVIKIKGRKQTCVDSIVAKDIKQGGLGNCSFMSAMASLANSHPQMLSKRFLFEVNPSHFYAVQLFIDGQWTIIKTDDQFQCQNGCPIGAKSKENQIWVMLIEKTLAKAFGSYTAIESWSAEQAFFVLTGAPVETILTNQIDQREIEKRIQQAKKKGYIMSTSVNDELKKMGVKAQEELGLVGDHAYSLLGVYNIRFETLLKLRNPWGSMVWKGDWSFHSKKWTIELKRHFDFQKDPHQGDGSFFISWCDFQKYFYHITICQMNPTFTHTSFHMINNPRKSNYVQMKVTVKGTYRIFVCQEGRQKFQPHYKYSDARVILVRKYEKISLEYIDSRSTHLDQVCTVEAALEEGTYIVSAKVAWKNGTDRGCFLTAYGPEKVSFQKVDRSIAPKFKQEVLVSFARSMKENVQVTPFNNYQDVLQQSFIHTQYPIGFLKIVNNSQKQFHCKISMTMKGMKVIKPKQNPNQFIVPPGSEDLMGFFLSAERGYQLSKSFQFLA